MDAIKELKKKVTLEKIFNRLGLKYSEKGLVRCPFKDHKDENKSFKVYKASERFCCFGCGEKGDVIDFVRIYKGLDFKEALEWLSKEFKIMLVYRGRKGVEFKRVKELYKRKVMVLYKENKELIEGSRGLRDRFCIMARLIDEWCYIEGVDDFNNKVGNVINFYSVLRGYVEDGERGRNGGSAGM